ncbi:Proline iminopeptidase [hydrothermal vent metagenome]|uniref:prolyl aminopeptidase n=1 Tax=hydrothermal vent metagenome TaxID=652676 RepID=A0A3B0Z985_9ZZZZ
MSVLFPALKPYQTYYWDVDDLHTLYIEESGNPKGLPILFLHGGPGGACADYNRQFFNPEHYRIIMFDQRGCGQSQPHAELNNNTTQDLLADIELIRKNLEIEQWVLFGGSWGSTLALLYTQKFPQLVLGLILRGIFLARATDINWLFQEGAGRIFPEQWSQFKSVIAESRQDQMVNAYFDLLTGDNEISAMKAALAWAEWEASCSALVPEPELIKRHMSPFTAMSLARLECHYMKNSCFVEPDQILLNMDKIAQVPGIIVHGRYDIVCPVEQATLLHEKWPESSLNLTANSGHAATEDSNLSALVVATKQMYEYLQ